MNKRYIGYSMDGPVALGRDGEVIYVQIGSRPDFRLSREAADKLASELWLYARDFD